MHEGTGLHAKCQRCARRHGVDVNSCQRQGKSQAKLANFREADLMGVQGITEEAVPFEKRIEASQSARKSGRVRCA